MENLSGNIIKGYDLLERIGAGGFGAVYRAYQSTVGREVAVKIILPAYANKPAFIRRFEIEAQLVARLEHLHIVPLYDYWRDHNGAYIVMRWLRGGSLSAALRKGAFDLEPASLLLDQVASGLAAAHYQQIVHRDLKPSNILLDEEGNAYLADFGIARDLNRANGADSGKRNKRHDSGSGEHIRGSIQYLAPEQLLGQPSTPRSDIYSLGITLYEVLSGQHPFPELNSVQQLYKHIDEPLPGIEIQDLEVSEAVNQVIQKATAKNPKHRFQDPLAMAAAFRDAARRNGDNQSDELVEPLSRREQEILQLVIAGNTNQQIAQALFLELSTVKWHLNRVYKKLGVRSRVQAIVRAKELDLIVSTTEKDLEPSQKTSISLVLPEPVNPYKGLRAFEPADKRDFFGREALVEQLLSRLAPTNNKSPSRSALGLATNGSERFLAIVGPSGSGKSSLIKAGLIPALWSGQLDGSDNWFIVDLLPGAQPLDNLEIALTRIAADQAENLHEHLKRDSQGLARAARLILPNDDSELLVVIDQFEELFTLVEAESVRNHFMDLILGAVNDAHSRVRVVIALRADYYDRPLQYPAFGELVRGHLVTLLPLSAEELERAIVNPAHQAGVTFEPGLVATIIEDVNYRPGALPLLQFALAELFEQRDGRMLTQNAYQVLGGAAGALARRAEELYQEQDAESRAAIRQMFLRLVSVDNLLTGETAEVLSAVDTRKRVLRSELLSTASEPERLDDIIDTYADYRLLSLDHQATTRRATVEVAHEAILREWDRLQGWLQESLVDLSLHHQLVQATREWIEAGGDRSFLLRGTRLDRFESWVSDTPLVLIEDERAFLEASIGRREARTVAERARNEQEAHLERQSNRRLKALVGVMAVAVVMAVGLAIAAITFAQRVEEQQRIVAEKDRLNYAQELVSVSRANLELDPELSVLLALEAAETVYSTEGTLHPEVEGLLRDAVQNDRVQLTIQLGGLVAFSPDGQSLAIGNQYGVMKLYDATTGQSNHMRILHQPLIGDMVFSPDGRLLATSNHDMLVNIWDVASDQNIAHIQAQAKINGIAFNPNGQHLVTAGADGAVRRWDLAPVTDWVPEDGEPVELVELAPILLAPGEAVDVAFSSNGRYVAILFPGESIIIMDLDSGQQTLEIAEIGYFATGVTFSPDGDLVASTSSDQEATVWDVRTGEKFLTVQESAIITEVAFSPDGRYLATSAVDGKATLWELETGREILRLSGHSTGISSISFSPDGRQLATSNGDGIVGVTRIWDIDPEADELLLFTVPAHQGKVHDAVYSPDGTRIASAGEDGAVKVWEAATGKLLHNLPGQKEWVHFPAFSPDSQRLAAANRESGVTIWDAITGKQELVLEGDALAYTAVAFSPDGDRLAAGGPGSIAHIWDAVTGERLTDIRYDGDYIVELLFTPDGDQIKTYDWASLEITWDAVTGEPLDGSFDTQNFAGGDDHYWDVELTADGQLHAAACSAAYVSRISGAVLSELHVIRAERGRFTGVAFNPEGTVLATSSTDGLAKLWDMETGGEIATLSDHTPSLGGIDISPDGRYLVTAGSDGSVSVFIISGEELMELARSRLSRGFTREECQRYLGLPRCVED